MLSQLISLAKSFFRPGTNLVEMLQTIHVDVIASAMLVTRILSGGLIKDRHNRREIKLVTDAMYLLGIRNALRAQLFAKAALCAGNWPRTDR